VLREGHCKSLASPQQRRATASLLYLGKHEDTRSLTAIAAADRREAIMRNRIFSLLLVSAVALVTGSVVGFAAPPDPADFSTTIDNPLFPLSSLGPKVFDGETVDPDTGDTLVTRLESRVLPQTDVVAGVAVVVLEEKAYEDGELIEVALDYFAQNRDGSVYYLGERVDNYEGGVIVNHDGQWLSGEGQNEPGIVMPAQPVVGQTYDQENAPGIAEDKATVLSINESVTVPAGTFSGCLKTRDFSPLDPGIEEFKFYCPGVGLVREEAEGEFLDLTSVQPAPTATATANPTVQPPTASPTPQSVVVPANTGAGGHEGDGKATAYIIVVGAIGLALVGLGALGVRGARRA
jgi:hypothetical protein